MLLNRQFESCLTCGLAGGSTIKMCIVGRLEKEGTRFKTQEKTEDFDQRGGHLPCSLILKNEALRAQYKELIIGSVQGVPIVIYDVFG